LHLKSSGNRIKSGLKAGFDARFHRFRASHTPFPFPAITTTSFPSVFSYHPSRCFSAQSVRKRTAAFTSQGGAIAPLRYTTGLPRRNRRCKKVFSAIEKSV
jgi:hypothetical protein